MERKIIQIDERKCNGCGACASACHEQAIQVINGKAVLTRDDYCDGLGDCLPACPMNAIRFVVREAAAYDEEAVLANKKRMEERQNNISKNGFQAFKACPGTLTKRLITPAAVSSPVGIETTHNQPSALAQWPVQLKLVPTKADYFDGSKLLIAADCSAYAYASFHERFMNGRSTVIACPKLDAIDYTEKLTAIIRENDIKSVTIVRMEVPCCGGLEHASVKALKQSGKFLPWNVVTLSIDGRILQES